jgi:hypothetical protein
MVKGLEIKFEGYGFGVKGSRVKSTGHRALGLGFMSKGLWFRV